MDLKQIVDDSLALDFCRRSIAASYGFIVVFSILLIMPIVSSPSWILLHQFAAALALICSLLRLVFARKISKGEIPALRKWGVWHERVILTSSTCLGLLCTMGFYDPRNSDAKIFVTSFLISAIMAGSTSSLSLNSRIHKWFLLVVGVAPGIALAVSNHTGRIPYTVWTIFVFTFVLYVYVNAKEFRRNMSLRYETEEHLRVEQQNLTAVIEKLELTQQELLEQKASAEYSAKLASLGEMAGGVAHEINTPLNVILLSTEQQLEMLDDTPLDVAQMRASIEKVQSTTNRIAVIVRGLRVFARDGSHDPIEKVPVGTVIDNTLALCYEKFKLNNVDLRLPKNSEGVFVKCRPVQLSQVLLNLLNNAFEAIRDLKEKWIAIELRELSEDIEIRVIDSGPGIPVNLQEEIFRPFFTTKGIGKGTGLGLSISRGLIESHQGRLFIDSESSNTCFVIRLPR
ncbi:MAG: sensor histidine kinase [Bacillota bacterium]